MIARSFCLTTAAPAAAVFRALADIEYFPVWAAEYCERLELSRGRWRAFTVAGDLFVELEADARTGVIDLRLGGGEGCERLLPLRVAALPGGRTFVSAVFYRAPEQAEAAFTSQCGMIEAALRRLLEGLEREAVVAV